MTVRARIEAQSFDGGEEVSAMVFGDGITAEAHEEAVQIVEEQLAGRRLDGIEHVGFAELTTTGYLEGVHLFEEYRS